MSNIIRDDYLGVIQFSEENKCYVGKINNGNGKSILFYLQNLDVEKNLKKVLKYTREIVHNIISDPLKYKLFAAEELLELYNDCWSEEEIIDTQEFVKQITLEEIEIDTVGTNNSASIWYDDGDLFLGHSIIICINSKGEPEEADIMG